jgi:ribosome maturation factor RimP
MEKDYQFTIGQRIKMQPFIDSNDWVFGTVKEFDNKSVVIDWDDKPDEKFRHNQDEYCDFKLCDG